MIRKIFLKIFYILTFAVSQIIFNIDAMAADETITITSTTSNCFSTAGGICASLTAAAAATCPSEEKITLNGSNGSYKIIAKCNESTVVDITTLKSLCVLYCNNILAQIKGDVADETYNISQNTFTKSICNALRVVTGSAGKTFAAFAIIATGIGFFTGKVSWGLMIGVTAGIATMFGAPSIVAAISGQDMKTSCKIN